MEAGEPRTAQSASARTYSNQSNHDQYPGREYSYPRDPRDVRDQQDPRDPREFAEPASASTMAAAALISPNTPYYPHYPQSAYAAGHYHQSPGHTHSQAHQAQPPSQSHHSHPNHAQTAPAAPGMISPVDSRRTSDDHDMSANRQSLPSIQEVIGKNASSYPPAGSLPQANSSSSSMPPQAALPSPFATNAPPRPFPGDTSADSQQSSPRSLHHAPPGPMYGPRPVASFPEPLRPQHTGGRSQAQGPHPSPPLPGIDAQDRRFPPAPPPPHHISQPQPPHPHHSLQHAPPSHPSQHAPQPQPPHRAPHEPVPRHHSPYPYAQAPLPPHPRDGRSEHDGSPPPHHAYPHMSGQHPPYPAPSVAQQQLPPPPGHSPYSGSPHHNGQSALPSPYEQLPNPMPDQPEFNRQRARYDDTVNRHFEAWSYAEYLARIGSNARTIFNFADAFGSIAREEHGPQPMPGRMPGDREVVEMISNAEWLKTMLENLRVMVQQTVVSERGPGGANRPKPGNGDGMDLVYDEPAPKPYALNEVKKRRGRAAPPGRCHSCNRIDTPEWRRGPDGARTLCNACGLHYAKLERKKQLENRQIRPKHPDEQRH